MTFAVLMSVYYKETGIHLDRSLNSIWTEQTVRPDQVVLVQDGPLTDELYSVIEKWKHIMGTILVSPVLEKNSGLVSALNRGLDFVVTDLVARNDSDDFSAPDRFEKQLLYMQQHSEIAVLGGAIQEFDDEHPCLGIRHYPTDKISSYICKATPVAHPTVMMRMNMFKESGLRYDPNYPMNEDIALWFDVLRSGYKITNLDDVIYYFECGGGMFERRSRQKAKSEFLAYMRGIKDLRGWCTYKYMYPISRYCFRMLPIRWIALIYNSKLRQHFLKKN